MNTRKQICSLSAVFLLAVGIATLPIFGDVYANPQKNQEIEVHVNEAIAALNNNDVQGAQTHLQLAQELLSADMSGYGNKTMDKNMTMMQDHNMSAMTTG